uniref:SCP domain-containing protein n=1 Tax=Mesocestoides corti TaxID=53468 RepID=A0A5K3G117_MESCO
MQIVFAKSRQVGCYRRLCEHSDFWTTPQYVMACLYKPGRRNRYERPYQRGSICSGCPRRLGCYRKQCTEMTTLGVVRVPLEESVVHESAATKKQFVQIQTTSSTKEKSLIQTQKVLSPTKIPLIQTQTIVSVKEKPSIKMQQVTARTPVTSSLIQTPSSKASKPPPSTSFSTHLSSCIALMVVIMAIIFLS